MGPGNPTSDGVFGEGLSVEGHGRGKCLGTLVQSRNNGRGPQVEMGVQGKPGVPDTSLQRHWIHPHMGEGPMEA